MQWNLPLENSFFTGRNEVLSRLHKALPRHWRVALSGLPGIGKTQIAVEYAHQYGADYRAILFSRANTLEQFISDLAAMASPLDLPQKDEKDLRAAALAVKFWLEANKDWLLIIDNADSLPQIRDFIPAGRGGHTLLTTRSQVTGAIAEKIEITKLPSQEAASFLLRRAMLLNGGITLSSVKAEYRKAALTIAQEVDGLPLALDQAGAFIEATPSTPPEYLALYKRAGADLRSKSDDYGTYYQPSVFTTFSLAFEKVVQANQAAGDLLRLCSFLAPDSIPEEVIVGGAPELGEALNSAAADPLTRLTVIQEAGRYSLLRRDAESSRLSIHRLVQAVLQDSMDAATQRLWAERTVRTVNRTFPRPDISNWRLCDLLLPHGRQCAELIKKFDLGFIEAGTLLLRMSAYMYERAMNDEAEQYARQSLAIHERKLGCEHVDTAQAMNLLANIHHAKGSYADAATLYQKILLIQKKALGEDHPDVAQTLDSLAIVYDLRGRYQDAMSLYLQALRIREQASEPKPLEIAKSLHNLANAYYHQGSFQEALVRYQKVLEIREKESGPMALSVAYALNNLASTHESLGQYSKAERLHQRALSVLEEVLGPNHPDVAFSLGNLALIYQHEGSYAEAEKLLTRALSIRVETLGEAHPDVAYTLGFLAGVYKDMGRLSDSESLLKRALAIRRKALGASHHLVGNTLTQLGDVYFRQGLVEEAEKRLRRAHKILGKAVGDGHLDFADCLYHLAEVLSARGDHIAGRRMLESAVKIQEKLLGPEHDDTKKTLKLLGRVKRR